MSGIILYPSNTANFQVMGVYAQGAQQPAPASAPTPPPVSGGFFKQLVGSNCGIEVADLATFRVDTASGAQFTQSGTTTLELDQTASYLQNNNAQVFIEGATNFLVDSGAQVLFTNSALVQCSTDGNAGSGPAVVVGGTSDTRLTVDGGTLYVDVGFDEFAVGNASGNGILIINGTLNCGQPSTNSNAGLLLVSGFGGDGNAQLTIASGATLNVYTSIASGVFESQFRLVGNLTVSGRTVTIQDAQVVSLAGAVLANYTYVPTGLSVAFADTSYADGSFGSVTSWAWNFGDSGSSTSQNPTHVYASSGTYTVVLTATTSGGKTSSCTRKVTVA